MFGYEHEERSVVEPRLFEACQQPAERCGSNERYQEAAPLVRAGVGLLLPAVICGRSFCADVLVVPNAVMVAAHVILDIRNLHRDFAFAWNTLSG